jgi:hypothetical protein
LRSGTEFEAQSAPWTPWNVYWSAIWVGALAALVAALIFGLVGTAVGATTVEKFSSWKTITLVNLAFVVFATFFAFAIGGWCAGKVTGALHAERTIRHASIAWLVAMPMRSDGQPAAAMASISIRAPSGSAATANVERAGGTPVKNSP